MRKRSAIFLVSLVLIVVLIWQSLREDYGVGVDSVRWLPSEARNITYLKMPVTNTMAEFEIDQEAFEKWSINVDMPLRVLDSNEEGRMHRCLPYLESRGVIPVVPEPKGDSVTYEEYSAWLERSAMTFKAGDLYYEDRWGNGGGYALGYDVEEGMGYYWYGHH